MHRISFAPIFISMRISLVVLMLFFIPMNLMLLLLLLFYIELTHFQIGRFILLLGSYTTMAITESGSHPTSQHNIQIVHICTNMISMYSTYLKLLTHFALTFFHQFLIFFFCLFLFHYQLIYKWQENAVLMRSQHTLHVKWIWFCNAFWWVLFVQRWGIYKLERDWFEFDVGANSVI